MDDVVSMSSGESGGGSSNGGNGPGGGVPGGGGGTGNVGTGSPPSANGNESNLIRVRVPELNMEKCLQFQRDELIWEVKQQILAALPKELEESFNYGLFMPPSNGKAGKFLDEERRLSEYALPGPIGYLEMKYKRRVYKMLQMDEKVLKSVNSKANHKKFVDHVVHNNVDKVNKLCSKGLDPNFHCTDNDGETPLCLASGLKSKPARMLIALVNGGAIVDYRTKDGSTAIHKSVAKNNSEALRTLLDLGASPNYKDSKGLTPLYLTVSLSTDVLLTEMLLHDRALVGAQDLQGWQEVHQACRNGLVAHLEQLLFYTADMNTRNASGNTPLHVCAVNNQESCARTLLFRGADKEALNYAGQTAYQVAVIAGNLELGEVIKKHKVDDVVPFKDAPKYNPRRRVSAVDRSVSNAASSSSSSCAVTSSPTSSATLMTSSMTSSMSGGSIMSSVISPRRAFESPMPVNHNTLRPGMMHARKPPSPSPSDRSLPMFSSSGSSMSETSTGSSSLPSSNRTLPMTGAVMPQQMNNPSAVAAAAAARGSLPVHAAANDPTSELLDSASALAVSMTNDSHMEILSLSSGVGTSSHSGSAGSTVTPTESPIILPGMHVVCLENFTQPGCLHITQGDIIEVTAPSEEGMLEGRLRGQVGRFPSHCVQEVRLRGTGGSGSAPPPPPPPNSTSTGGPHPHLVNFGSPSNGGQQMAAPHQSPLNAQLVQQHQQQARVAGRRELSTISTKDKIIPGESRRAVLHKGKRGFGFVLRGAKAASPLMEMIPSSRCPGLQYMDDVDPGGVADMAGINKGDFLLEINNEDVRRAGHEQVVNLIRKSGDLVSLTVVTVLPQFLTGALGTVTACETASANASPSMSVNSATNLNNNPANNSGRQYSTLPRKLHHKGPMAIAPSNAGNSTSSTTATTVQPPPPPKRNPNTTLSIGKARARSMVANMSAIEALDKAISEHESGIHHTSLDPSSAGNRMPDLVESSNKNPLTRSASSVTNNGRHLSEEGLFEKSKNKVYASVAEMKRSKLLMSGNKLKVGGVVSTDQIVNGVVIHKDFHSTPDLKKETEENGHLNCVGAGDQIKPAISQDNFNNNCNNGGGGGIDSPGGVTPDEVTLKMMTSSLDDRIGSQRGYFTLPSRNKRMVIDPEGNYRAVSKIRPVKISQNATPPPPPPPPEHPPPPPPGMEGNSDVVVSPGGTVRSSFKPSDTAKLYASPETSASVGFRKQLEAGASEVSENGADSCGSPSKKQRSPTARANSMPPKPSRPQVLRRAQEPQQLPPPPPPTQEDNTAANTAANTVPGASTETYSVNGVSYTTYTTFRSPITPDEVDAPSFSGRGLFGGGQELVSSCGGADDQPVIPEPDYDDRGGPPHNHPQQPLPPPLQPPPEIRMGSKTLERSKKKKSVSFVDEVGMASVKPSSINKVSRATTHLSSHQPHHHGSQDSILKDPSRQQQQEIQSHQKSILCNPFAANPEKYTQPINRIPTAKLKPHPATAPATMPPNSTSEPMSMPAAAAPAKIRIEVPPVVPNKLNRSDSTAGESSAAAQKVTLQKSLSFCADKSGSAAAAAAVKLNVSAHNPVVGSGSAPTGSVAHPTENEILRVRSQLKPSRSFPNELKQQEAAANETDNSSSGVSSDHENQAAKYVTYLPVDGGAASTTLEIGNQQQQPQPGKPQQPSGKSASSRAPTTGAFDNVSESGSDDVSSERSWVLRAEQDNLTGRNIVYMKKMLHPKLQAIFDKPVKPGDYSTQTLPARGHHNHNVHGHHHVTGVIKGGGSSDEPRSISQSLALINHSLGEVTQQQAAASAPPEGAGGGAGSGAASVLAPPPGFSDSEATFSDTDSFSSNGSQFRSGSKTLDSIQSLNHQLGAKDNLMTRSMGPQLDLGAGSPQVQAHHHHHPHQQHQAPPKKNRVTFAKTIMSASTSEFDMNKNGGSSGVGAKKEFRNKPLIGWSVGDVCDWLDSLFMPEYKPAFVQSEVDGFKLASITKGELEAMGVIRVGHMMNIEKSLKRYLTA